LLKDESLEDSANLPDPDVIAAEIVEDLEAALQQFAAIASDLGKKNGVASKHLTLTLRCRDSLKRKSAIFLDFPACPASLAQESDVRCPMSDV